MKKVLVAMVFMFSVNSFAFTSCKSEAGENGSSVFSVSFYHTDSVRALVIDKRVSRFPLSYICEKTTMVNDDETLVAYACLGGGFNEESYVAFFVNETTLLANYQDSQNEENDLENLSCEIL